MTQFLFFLWLSNIPLHICTTFNDFSAFLNRRRCKNNWAHKIFWKHKTIWRLVLPVFPRAQRLHSWSPPWTPFRGSWRAVAPRASDFVLAEAGARGQFSVGILSLDGKHFHRTQGPSSSPRHTHEFVPDGYTRSLEILSSSSGSCEQSPCSGRLPFNLGKMYPVFDKHWLSSRWWAQHDVSGIEW